MLRGYSKKLFKLTDKKIIAVLCSVILLNWTNVVFLFILDFDGDNFLNKTDLERTLRCLTRNELTAEEVAFVVEKVSKASA